MTTIGHVSVYAAEPERTADLLVQLLGGMKTPFRPLPGAFTYHFGDGSDGFIELYPRGYKMIRNGTRPSFEPLSGDVNGYATHINLQVNQSLQAVAAKATALGLPNGIRFEGLLDVWLEDELLIEVSPQ